MVNNIDIDLMNADVAYPSPSDSDFQLKVYEKREFYYNKIQQRKKLVNDDDIKDHRDKICGGERSTFPQQAFLANYINPNTPYDGLLIFHGVGTGKTCAAIKIAEQFKETATKYDTKIYVLVSGPLLKENWKNEILLCTGNTYMKDMGNVIDKQAINKEKKNAIGIINQHYRFISHRGFYKKVLGERIIEKVADGDKIKASYRKNEDGDYERDEAVDKLYNLNNSVLIVDEAHNLIDNDYGNAIKKIIENSVNLKVILLTATPMPNKADDAIGLFNLILPKNKQLQRDKIFTRETNYNMKIKPGGIEYLQKMTSGYVSYLRGADPITFAERVDKGIIPKGLIFTRVIKCKMLDFQLQTYTTNVMDTDDALDKKSEAISNFVFPGLNDGKTDIVGYYGRNGINILKNQIITHGDVVNNLINKKFFENKLDDSNLVNLTANGRNITGNIFKYDNLKHFSIKFYSALQKLKKLVSGGKGVGTAFIYSNLVKVGIELFQEILIQNGYLPFEESGNYSIKSNIICYYCGHPYSIHDRNTVSDHDFAPSTFLAVTGKTEDNADMLQEEKQQMILKHFNNIKNKDGKIIKFILGSKVMNEGITLKNVREIHILDVAYNLNSIDQVMGRAIRHCVHHDITTDENRNPKVNVYKYVVALENELSSEEKMYKKAEMKYLLVKKIERALKESAIDCPLNRPGNIFPEELEKYKDCKMGTDNPCPAICDHTQCDFKCVNPKLNDKYFKNNNYVKIPQNKLDYSTFNKNLAKSEIEYAKQKIKEMYKINTVYTLEQIISYIYESYDIEKQELFDNFFVHQALDELIPITENEFNNFNSIVHNKYNNEGYIIYRNKYYIFQPFNENEDVPMYYRTRLNTHIDHKVSLYKYMKNTDQYKNYIADNKSFSSVIGLDTITKYNYEDTYAYYDKRKEYDFIGIIDKESTKRKITDMDEVNDVFKIKDNRVYNKNSKLLLKKRGTGIPSNKGAVCTTYDKSQLIEYAKRIKIPLKEKESKAQLCSKIQNKLLFMEKYSDNGYTYIKIPTNHPVHKFPYNLIDRTSHIITIIKENIKFNLSISQKKEIDKKTKLVFYTIKIADSKKLKEFYKLFTNLGGDLSKDTWTFKIH
jgi:superfamily II DNA or RNA helicase